MDNGSVTANTTDDILWAYDQLRGIFEPYKFALQQFCTNDRLLEEKLDEDDSERKGSDDSQVDLFGLKWDKYEDTLSTKKKTLDINANTKRLILKNYCREL